MHYVMRYKTIGCEYPYLDHCLYCSEMVVYK